MAHRFNDLDNKGLVKAGLSLLHKAILSIIIVEYGTCAIATWSSL